MSIQFTSEDPALILLTTLIGFSVLVIGRQLFWVFIGGLGFALGLFLSSQYYNAQFEWQILLISSIAALLGAVLAYTVERLAAGIAGLATGWYLTSVLMGYYDPTQPWIGLVVPIIVGIIFGVLLMAFFNQERI